MEARALRELDITKEDLDPLFAPDVIARRCILGAVFADSCFAHLRFRLMLQWYWSPLYSGEDLLTVTHESLLKGDQGPYRCPIILTSCDKPPASFDFLSR